MGKLLPSFCLAILALRIAEASVQTIFVFGDSTVDVGTNNYLQSCKDKADTPFNGIDFRGAVPTGRFSNGFNSADFLAKLMGFSASPPPFLSLKDDQFQKHLFIGMNFASGGSGILDPTGKLLFGEVVRMSSQVQQFSTVHGNLTSRLGAEPAASFLSKSMFLISVGSNDIFEYFFFHEPHNDTEFFAGLMSQYKDHLTQLYNMGARKFGIIAVPPIGFCPVSRSTNSSDDLNRLAKDFYFKLLPLLEDLSSELKGMKYSLGNAYQMVINFMHNPLPFGFKELKKACCGGGIFNGQDDCTPTANLCTNRHNHLFWDRYHPTEAAARLAAETLYGAQKEFVSPINFRQLAADDC